MHIGSWPNSSSQRLNQERETHSYCEASLYEHQRKERRFLRAPFPLPPLSTLLPSPPPPSLIQFRPRLTISGFYLIVFLLPSQCPSSSVDAIPFGCFIPGIESPLESASNEMLMPNTAPEADVVGWCVP
ncbi:hypothetical protein HZH68_000771 [Vespula germanica]|uniref:Uncharacterized protein n=1 Tax=Vespula germanica TaxID=30212 RepID=A0A834NU81_VESGE|nr:hypothetical protein HZH68_000771 [Vespula germanica]